MKKAIALFGLMALVSSAFAAAEIGKPAPDFTGTDINGKTIHLSDYKGKIVVLESDNQDCPYCQNEFRSGAMQELQKEMTSKGVIWLMVNSVNPRNRSHRTPEQARVAWKEQRMNATAWIDDSSGEIARLYDMLTTPHMFVIDKTGTLVYDGAIDDQPDPFHDPHKAHNYVRDAVEKIMAGENVTVAQTKPYGCAEKY
jgi:peroxiredoxin